MQVRCPALKLHSKVILLFKDRVFSRSDTVNELHRWFNMLPVAVLQLRPADTYVNFVNTQNL